MDILRARLGEEKLNYLGKSYGTYLGATYADLFPQLVGRFVLDGVVAPDLTSAEVNLGQAKGFETATRAWAQFCIDKGDCPLGSTVDDVMQGIRDFLTQVDEAPLPKTGDTAVTELTEGWASTGIASAMYDEGMWDTLVEAMRAALQGDGSDLMGLANSYADRQPGGGYSGNIMEVIYAVNCLDKPESADIAEHEASGEGFPDGGAHVGAVPRLVLDDLRLLAGQDRALVRTAQEGDGRGRQPDRRRGHDPRPCDALRVVGPAARPAGQELTHHVRRRRAHGIHAVQQLRRQADRRLLPQGNAAPGRAQVLIG